MSNFGSSGDAYVTKSASAPVNEVGNRPLDEVLEAIEKKEIEAALRLARGQRTLAARLLHISRSRLYRRMEALGIEPQSQGAESTTPQG
ncbi:MAG: helix-turn-helix domain-containing protein [Planctomycetota bacterium]|jgi:DNA-binding NtrC family response regulator